MDTSGISRLPDPGDRQCFKHAPASLSRTARSPVDLIRYSQREAARQAKWDLHGAYLSRSPKVQRPRARTDFARRRRNRRPGYTSAKIEPKAVSRLLCANSTRLSSMRRLWCGIPIEARADKVPGLRHQGALSMPPVVCSAAIRKLGFEKSQNAGCTRRRLWLQSALSRKIRARAS